MMRRDPLGFVSDVRVLISCFLLMCTNTHKHTQTQTIKVYDMTQSCAVNDISFWHMKKVNIISEVCLFR